MHRAIPVLILILSGCFYFGDLGPNDARALVAEGALLVDVRTTEEFAEGHIDGALNIPVDELESRLTELEPKERAVILYCRSGMRSSRAKSILQDHGYKEVYNFGSMSRWE